MTFFLLLTAADAIKHRAKIEKAVLLMSGRGL